MKASTLISVSLVLLVSTSAAPQELITYAAHWTLPRDHWQAAAEYDEKYSIPVYEKLVDDGTIVHWGIDEPFVHDSGARTHGEWFAVTSMAALDEAMAAFGNLPENPTYAVSEEHHDHLMRSLLHGGRSGNVANGYFSLTSWELQPGKEEAWLRLFEEHVKPVYDELVSEGTVVAWEASAPMLHSDDASIRNVWYVVADGAAEDEVREKFRARVAEKPSAFSALRSLANGHRDYLSRTHMQHE